MKNATKSTGSDTVVARTYESGACYELVLAATPLHGCRYYFTIDGRVKSANDCWMSDAAATEFYDSAAYQVGSRP